MSNQPRHDSRTLRIVLGHASPPAEVEHRIIDGVMEGIRRRRRQRHITLGGLAVAAMAACLLIALWPGGDRKRDPDPSHEAAHRAAIEKLHVAGTVWSASTAPLAKTIGPHRAELAPYARLGFQGGTAESPQLEVSRGKVRFVVAPLKGSFVVRTQQARVTVLGTVFSVEIKPRCTRVEVARGIVNVESRHEGTDRKLRAGEALTVCDSALKGTQLDQDTQSLLEAITLTRKGEKLQRAERMLAAYLQRRPDGTYTEEALFFLILVKKRLGQHGEAARLTRSFLERFPSTTRASMLRSGPGKNTTPRGINSRAP